MEYFISEKVIFVEGFKNAAIYDLKNNKVYSVNDISKDIINRIIIKNEAIKTEIEANFINSLKENNLYNFEFKVIEYKTERLCAAELNFVWLEITQACNLKCLHCYTGEIHKQSYNILNVEDWINIIDQLFNVGCRRIQFIGGEPCIYHNLITLINYAGEKGFEGITIFTNATIINNELIDCIKKNNVNIRFSLYGHNANIHDSVTKINGSFNKTIENIKRLLNENINVSPAVIAMRENQDYIENIKLFIQSLDLKYSGYDVIRNVFGGTQTSHTPTNEIVINNSKFTKPAFFTDEESFFKAYLTNTCWYGKFAITETGMVLPCVFERNIILGDLKKQSITEILESDILKKHWFLTLNQVKTCIHCEFKYSCRDCRPLGKGDKGDLFDKNQRCTYNPKTGDWKNNIKDDINFENCDFYS